MSHAIRPDRGYAKQETEQWVPLLPTGGLQPWLRIDKTTPCDRPILVSRVQYPTVNEVMLVTVASEDAFANCGALYWHELPDVVKKESGDYCVPAALKLAIHQYVNTTGTRTQEERNYEERVILGLLEGRRSNVLNSSGVNGRTLLN